MNEKAGTFKSKDPHQVIDIAQKLKDKQAYWQPVEEGCIHAGWSRVRERETTVHIRVACGG